MMIVKSLRDLTLAIGALTAMCAVAWAQSFPQAATPQTSTRNPICLRLEAQLAAFDRGGQDAGRSEQIRRLEDALHRQQAQVERLEQQSQRLGCRGGGFFSLFQNQPPQCTGISNQVQQLRTSVSQLIGQIQQLQGGSADRSGQRQAIIAALARNDCGPQYRSAAQPQNFFEALFGPGTILNPGAGGGTQSSTYRTLCVRTCDGYYFPISFATVPARFGEDEQACRRMCPAAQVLLFSHRNPGEDVAQAVSSGGGLYADLPNAFKYRKAYDPACSCKQPGQTWAEALKNVDDPSIESGDIVVTEEKAKAMSMPRTNGRAPGTSQQTTPATTSNATVQPSTGNSGAADDEPTPNTAKRQIRTVGPTFLPAR